MLLTNVLRPAVGLGSAKGADGAPLLAEAADPAAAALVLLLVDVEQDVGRAGGVAGLVLLGGSVGEQGAVAGGNERDLEPGGVGRGDRDLALAARALDARDLGQGGALGDGHVGDRLAVVEVRGVAHVLVGAVGAVLDAVAAAAVGDELLVGADEVRLGARAGRVVAAGSGKGNGAGSGDHDRVEDEESQDGESSGKKSLHWLGYLFWGFDLFEGKKKAEKEYRENRHFLIFHKLLRVKLVCQSILSSACG